MYHLEFKKLESQGDSALSTCLRDISENATRSIDQPIAIRIKPKENKIEQSDEKQQNNPNIDIEACVQDELNQQNQSDDYNKIHNNSNNYQKSINKYVNSLNNILNNSKQNNNSNLIVPKRNPVISALSEESYYSYYDSGDESQRAPNNNDNVKNGQGNKINQQNNNIRNNPTAQMENQIKVQEKNKNQILKAQQLNVLLQTSTQKSNGQQQLKSSNYLGSEFAEGDERIDENYSYYEVQSNHLKIKQQREDTTQPNQMSQKNKVENPLQLRANQTNRGVTPLQDNINQSQSINIKTIENKSYLQQNKLDTSQVYSNANEDVRQNSSITEKCCKICLENDSTPETGEILSPCKCNGSMQYIHEECLKTWLVTQKVDIDSAACELCKMEYNMEITIGKQFQLSYACNEGQISFISCLCLFFLVVGMLTIIFLFAFKWEVINSDSSSSSSNNQNNGQNNNGNNTNSDSSNESSFSYKLSILIACIIICLVILTLLVLSIKEAFFIDYMKMWRIYNFDKEAVSKKKKFKNNKERAHLNQQAAINTRQLQTNILQSINNQSFMRNQNQQAPVRRGSQPSQPNNQTIQPQQNLSQFAQVAQNENRTRNQRTINKDEQQQQLQDDRSRLFDQSIINNLINDQSLNESQLNSTILHLRESNINKNNQEDQFNQYNLNQEQELQIAANLIDNQEVQKDDYCFNQIEKQNNTIEQKEQNNLQTLKNSVKIISQKSKQKLSQSNLSKQSSKGRYILNKINNNDDDIVGKTSLAHSKFEITPHNQTQIQQNSINRQIIGEEQLSQSQSGDANAYLEKINKILKDIPQQFQSTDEKNDVIYNVLITKDAQK